MSFLSKLKAWLLAGRVSFWRASGSDLDHEVGISTPKPFEYGKDTPKGAFKGIKVTLPLPEGHEK